MEEWRNVPGYEGLYQISIDTKEGKCRSLNYERRKIVKEFSNKPSKYHGRVFWGLTKNKKTIVEQAAYWIAITFPELVENEWFEGAEIDHKDTDRLNNNPSNLRWTTRKENQNNHKTLKNKSLARMNRPDLSKSVMQFKTDGTFVKEYPSTKQAERETGISNVNIGSVCRKKFKTAGGFVWCYAEEYKKLTQN